MGIDTFVYGLQRVYFMPHALFQALIWEVSRPFDRHASRRRSRSMGKPPKSDLDETKTTKENYHLR